MSGRLTRGTGGGGSGSGGGGGGDEKRSRGWVYGILTGILVGAVRMVQVKFTSAVEAVFGSFEAAFVSAGLSVEDAFSTAGGAVLGAQAAVNRAIETAASQAGFAAPLVVAILFAVAAVLTFAALRALLNGVKWVT